MAVARNLAPKTQAPRGQLAITASADLPVRPSAGASIPTSRRWETCSGSRARSLPVTASVGSSDGRQIAASPSRIEDAYGGLPVARIRQGTPTFRPFWTPSGVPGETRAQHSAEPDGELVAAGGWCAPSEIR
jgi:hypothetical protein